MREETSRCLVLTLLGLMAFFGFGGEVHGQGYIFNQMSGVNSNFSALHSSYGYAIAQDDFNHDGRLDFAVVENKVKKELCATGFCDMVSVYLAQVNGTYQLASSYRVPNGGLCYVVAVGDVETARVT